MATYTQSTNTDPTKAVYGEKSAGVLALQKALNAKGAGLKEDSLYGPLTQAAFNKYNTPTPSPYVNDTSKTIGSTFKVPTIQTETQAERDYADMQARLSRGEDIVDTSAIRSKTLADFQDRIDAINQVYAGKLAEAKQQGVGRVGSTTAILANRGLTGSARGGTIAEGTLTQNRQIEDAINAEKSAAISEIFSLVETNALAEAQRRREAMQSGAKNYIEFIKGQDTRKQTNISNVAGALLAQGIDPNTLSPEDLNNITSKIGATSGDLISVYKKLKLEENANNLKNFPTKELSQGEALYQYDPVTGTYKQTGFNPKTSTAKTTTGSSDMLYNGLPSTTATAVRGQVSAFKTEPLVTNFSTIQDGYNFVNSIPEKTTNPADDQALIYSLAKVLDPNSVVREGEYATAQKYSQSLINSYGKSITQALAGTGFLSEVARKNIKDTIKSRYSASKKSYDNLYNQYVKSINNLTGRDTGNMFLKDYSTQNTSTGAINNNGTTSEPDPLGLGI